MATGRMLGIFALLFAALWLAGGCSGDSPKDSPRTRNGDSGGAPDVPPEVGSTGTEPPDEMPPDEEPPVELHPDAMPPDEAPPREHVVRSIPRDLPVRVLVGPRPIELEAGDVEPGEDLRLVVRNAETKEIVHEQEFTHSHETVKLAARSEDGAEQPVWQPEPGKYLVQLWMGDDLVSERVVTFGR